MERGQSRTEQDTMVEETGHGQLNRRSRQTKRGDCDSVNLRP